MLSVAQTIMVSLLVFLTLCMNCHIHFELIYAIYFVVFVSGREVPRLKTKKKEKRAFSNNNIFYVNGKTGSERQSRAVFRNWPWTNQRLHLQSLILNEKHFILIGRWSCFSLFWYIAIMKAKARLCPSFKIIHIVHYIDNILRSVKVYQFYRFSFLSFF